MKRKTKKNLLSAAVMLSGLMIIGLCETCFTGALISVVIFAGLAYIGQASGVWDDE